MRLSSFFRCRALHTSAVRRAESDRRIRATPFIFLQRPLPYKRRSRESSWMPLPVAIVSTSVRSPMSSKSIRARF
jgi:hypothetical protein